MNLGTEALPVTASTLRPSGIARAVETHFPLGKVTACHLINRGFNDTYRVDLTDGRRVTARLSGLRARGQANIAYETALLRHLKNTGAHIAAPMLTHTGSAYTHLDAAEGRRAFAVFDWLPGDVPGDDAEKIKATGAGLAHLHTRAQSYSGPASLYSCDLPALLHRPLVWLLRSPNLEPDGRSFLQDLATRLEQCVLGFTALSEVTCHGDCHGGNNVMTIDARGQPVASFFDFDEAGPGYLAYDLAVFLWMQQFGRDTAIDGSKLALWHAFLNGYRSVADVTSDDVSAVSTFICVRHIWLMGEYASRQDEWGLLRTPWLKKQLDLLAKWETFETPMPG
jgi:Ser/Thr protein kinase RdoA (MazF antagonist)